MTVELTDDYLGMIREAGCGLDGPGVEQLIADVRGELEALQARCSADEKSCSRGVYEGAGSRKVASARRVPPWEFCGPQLGTSIGAAQG